MPVQLSVECILLFPSKYSYHNEFTDAGGGGITEPQGDQAEYPDVVFVPELQTFDVVLYSLMKKSVSILLHCIQFGLIYSTLFVQGFVVATEKDKHICIHS